MSLKPVFTDLGSYFYEQIDGMNGQMHKQRQNYITLTLSVIFIQRMHQRPIGTEIHVWFQIDGWMYY